MPVAGRVQIHFVEVANEDWLVVFRQPIGSGDDLSIALTVRDPPIGVAAGFGFRARAV